jgi:hypothetical protein
VTKDYRTRLVGCITQNSSGENFSYAPKPSVAECIMAVVHDYQFAIFGVGAFSNHDYRVTRMLRIAGMRG